MKVSIEREELERLREHIKASQLRRSAERGAVATAQLEWAKALSMLNAMIGKAGEPASPCKGCHFDGDCATQKELGSIVTDCLALVPASPHAPEYVTRQEMEVAIAKAVEAHEGNRHWGNNANKPMHMSCSSAYPVPTTEDIEAIVKAAVAEAMKAHEEKGHFVLSRAATCPYFCKGRTRLADGTPSCDMRCEIKNGDSVSQGTST